MLTYKQFCEKYNRQPNPASRRVYLIHQLGFEVTAETFAREDKLDEWSEQRRVLENITAEAQAEFFGAQSIQLHSLTIDLSGAYDNAERRTAELKSNIEPRMNEAKASARRFFGH